MAATTSIDSTLCLHALAARLIFVAADLHLGTRSVGLGKGSSFEMVKKVELGMGPASWGVLPHLSHDQNQKPMPTQPEFAQPVTLL